VELVAVAPVQLATVQQQPELQTLVEVAVAVA
jgi:hypothetical protein